MAEKQKKPNNKFEKKEKISELKKISSEERSLALTAQAKEAAKFYKSDPDLDLSGDEEIVEY